MPVWVGWSPAPGLHAPRRLHAQTHAHSLARAHPPPRAHVRTRAGSSPPPAARGSASPCSTQTCHPETQGDQGGGGTPTHQGPRPTSAPGSGSRTQRPGPANPALACPFCSHACCWPSRGLERPPSTQATSPHALRPSFAPAHLPHPAPGDPTPGRCRNKPGSQLPQHSATTRFTAVHRPVPPSAESRDCFSFSPSRVGLSASHTGWKPPVSNLPGASLSRGPRTRRADLLSSSKC